ncbi:hypothetical protein PILCRDRAFT_633900 [Piloderma croceum F 1598]|uniref:Uncharacterized protein n=1 Tax=Piloderma croceum (strain F 1598) TaxID=765440 RepID=A0A0C3FAE6_PILCF|nr:hypothetical protein PILCRDRAFT_633900 [Piloderma croceum F 1598]
MQCRCGGEWKSYSCLKRWKVFTLFCIIVLAGVINHQHARLLTGGPCVKLSPLKLTSIFMSKAGQRDAMTLRRIHGLCILHIMNAP